MHLSALFKRALIPFIIFLFTLLQLKKPYLILLINKELKIEHNAFPFKKRLVLYNTANVFCNFVFIVYICSGQFKLLSINTPKYL